MHIQDGLLAKEDEKLPFTGLVLSALEHFYFVKGFKVIVFMRTEEVIIGYPLGQVIVGTFDVVKAVCMTVRSLISTVEPPAAGMGM